MDGLFLYLDGIYIYWHGVVMTIALLVMLALVVFLRRIQNKSCSLLLIALLFSAPAAFFISRLSYWWFAKQRFGGASPFSGLTGGGHMLYAAMLGILLTFTAVYAAFRKLDQLAQALDIVAVSGAAAICVGRLSAFFSNDDRGMVISSVSGSCAPFFVYDSTTGNWQLAVFLMEAIAAAVIFLLLLFAFSRIEKTGFDRRHDGDLFALFLLSYGSFQAVLESLRSDSLYMVSLGLVRISQVISAVVIAAALVILSIKGIKAHSMHIVWWIIIWVADAALLVLAFIMELTLTSETLARGYAVMSACLAGTALSGWLIWLLRISKESPLQSSALKNIN